ncbi:MAG TPA: hypothetical protein VN417_04605 [Candidatus Cryosericum sp.]|nr:hypothetical protein [Candidatus Cryosericum sp.]
MNESWNITRYSGHNYTPEQTLAIYSPMEHKALTPEDVDAALQAHADLSILQATGLDQKSFEHMILRFGDRLRNVYFFSSPDIRDFSPLSGLPLLENVLIYWNRKAEALWDMRNNAGLKGIQISASKRLLLGLDAMPTAPNLEEIRLNGDVLTNHAIRDFTVFERCASLKRLSLLGVKVLDGTMEPLFGLKKLEILDFDPSFFTMDQIALLKAKLPAATGMSLCAYQLDGEDKARVNGKHMPTLKLPKQQSLLETYALKFEELVEEYRQS